MNHQEITGFIWQIAELLRGPYRPPQYERVMLPLTVLRRFDAVLKPTKEKVLAEYERRKGGKIQDEALDSILNSISGQKFHNHSHLDFEKLKNDPDNIDKHLIQYISGFSANVRKIFEYFEFNSEIERMREANILYLIISKFCDVDLHPDRVDNIEMGKIFEHLIFRFNEAANETAGDHFTPREVIKLMVNIIFNYDDKMLSTPQTVRKILDPACGTGGMLSEAQNYFREHNSKANLYVYGQDFNNRSYAIAASDLLIKGNEKSEIKFGDSLINDQYENETFDYLIANPPFGVDWKKQQKEIVRESEKLGFGGRFGAGLPRVNDGALLFLMHMISKFEKVDPKNKKEGSRLAIVFNGSPLFTGSAGSGESNIRKWIIEKDWLDAVIAMPEQMFYNTGIATYIWIVTNRKEEHRKGKIQLIDASSRWVPMKKSLGNKRRLISEKDISKTVVEYGKFEESENSKIFKNEEFGYKQVTVERPLRLKFQISLERKTRFLDACPHLLDDVQALDKKLGKDEYKDWNLVVEEFENIQKLKWKAAEMKLFREIFCDVDSDAKPVISKKRKPENKELDRLFGWFATEDKKGKPVEVQYEVDSNLRDTENIPLGVDVSTYFEKEVWPHVSDAWIDDSKTKIGYEIPFTRHFYKFEELRPFTEIMKEVADLERKIQEEIKCVLR